MISKNLLKLIRSLETKKGRKKENLYVAEGPKVVGDLLCHYHAVRLIATEEWFVHNRLTPRPEIDAVVNEEELKRISFLQHPQQVIGLFELREQKPDHISSADEPSSNLILALDGVQDPGNMGTIIRIADWFGITDIVCSEDSADAFNPKVVQATMGSIARVNITYTNLVDYLKNQPVGTPIYGTLLDGENIYTEELTRYGIIVMGNEGKGISQPVRQLINRRLLIPAYQSNGEIMQGHQESRDKAESLNVAIATAITCAEFRRRS